MAGYTLTLREAVPWVELSLRQGSALAHGISRQLGRYSRARLLAPAAYDVDLSVGRGIRQSQSDAVARDFLDDLTAGAGRTLVVEDDLADRSDPGSRGHHGYVGDVVLRWTDLKGPSALRLLRQGSSGYPLNAYVLTHAPDELGLIASGDIAAPAVAAIIRATCCVIVSCHDAEAYVALW